MKNKNRFACWLKGSTHPSPAGHIAFLHRSSTVWVIAVSLAVSGILLAMSLAHFGASASGDGVEMEVVQKNYDWGVTRPGGQTQEDAHRNHLDDQFRVEASRQGEQMVFKVFVPDPLILGRLGLLQMSVTVDYSMESAFHKYVDSEAACNNSPADNAVQLQGLEGRKTMVDMYVDITADNEDQYSCLVVKLKGQISGDSDTHPEWAFVSSPIKRVSAWPEISVVSDEQSIRIYSLAGASGLRFHFKYRILDEGDQCDQSAFAVAPNHPAVHRSTQFNIPDSPETRAYYDNRYVCFQATIINIDHDAYAPGDYIYRYRNVPIDLDLPVISVVSRTVVKGRSLSLGIDSNKTVTYRVGWYDTPLKFSSCKKHFATPGDLRNPDGISIEDKSQGLANKYHKLLTMKVGSWSVPHLCVEATDTSGNKTYIYVQSLWGNSNIGLGRQISGRQIIGGRAQTEVHAWFKGTSGKTVVWNVSGPSESDTCNAASSLDGGLTKTLPSDQTFVLIPEESNHGKYYCFQATDELGNIFYNSIQYYHGLYT